MSGDEGRELFEKRWPELRALLESDGVDALLARIGGQPEAERMALHRFARLGMVMDDWRGRNLDAYVVVADAGLGWLVELAGADAKGRDRYLEEANVISFNLAADLADCWPGDDLERARRHFERGRRAGEACVRWRFELAKPPGSMHLGYWALGYHQLRLGEAADALLSFQEASRYSAADATGSGEPPGVSPAAPFAVLLNAGYEALARRDLGRGDAAAEYEAVMRALAAQHEDAERAEDARFGMDQLEKVRGLEVA